MMIRVGYIYDLTSSQVNPQWRSSINAATKLATERCGVVRMTATVDMRVVSILVRRQTTELDDCYDVSRTQCKQNRAQYTDP